MANAKKYIITSITLGAIAASSALLIGLANMVTRDRIKQNEIAKTKAGLAEIYGSNATYGDAIEINDKNYPHLLCYYPASIDEQVIGNVFKASGKNEFGDITLLVGVSTQNEAGHIYLITNTQSYASTLVNNYVGPYNNGRVSLDDVSCGATHGAELVKELVDEAVSWSTAQGGGN